MKKALLLLLTLILALSMAACGGKGAEEKPDYVYVPEYHTVSGDFDYMSSVVCSPDGILYFSTNAVVDHKDSLSAEELLAYGIEDESQAADWMYEIYGMQLYRVNPDGSDLTKLESYAIPDMGFPAISEVSTSMNRMIVSKDGTLLTLESGYASHFANGEYISDGSKSLLRRLDKDGAEIGRIDISSFVNPEESWIDNLAEDDAGNLYFVDGNSNTVYVVDKDGALLFKIEQQDWVNRLLTLGDGTVAATMYTEDGFALKPIDMAKKGFGTAIELPMQYGEVYPGNGDYDLYFNNSSDLNGFRTADGTSELVLNWINSDVDSNNMNCLAILPDGRIFCATTTYTNDSATHEFIILTKTPYDQVPQKEEITLATIWLDSNLRSEIIRFNKTNPDYRIVVKEYQQYNTEEDYTAGLTKLSTEIVSGNIPDILVVDQLPVKRYAAAGLLEDLWPWIDQDSSLSREDLVTSVFAALEQEGKLYEIAPSFSVMTLIGATSVVGPDMGWTMADLNALMNANPDAKVFSYWTKDTALTQFCILNADDYVNWKTGVCSFDSEEFKNLLTFANRFPSTEEMEAMTSTDDGSMYVDDYQLIMEGKLLLYPYGLWDFYEYPMLKAAFGGEVTFIGYPTSSGVGNRINVESPLALSAASKHKEGAWTFMRTLLTEEYQKNIWSMPTNQNMLDKKFTDAMKEENNYVRTYESDSSTMEVDSQLKPEDKEELMGLINSVTGTYSYDEALLSIIQEEAAGYFAGQKSVDDTAKVIQSRVSLYVNEQL